MKGSCTFSHICCKFHWVKDGPCSLPFEPKKSCSESDQRFACSSVSCMIWATSRALGKKFKYQTSLESCFSQCTFPVSGNLQVGVSSARDCVHISMLIRFSWRFAGLKVASFTELSLLLRTGHEQAVEIKMTGPPRAGIYQLCVVEMSFTSSVLLMTPTDARRESGPLRLLYIA